jgi:NADH-quinone oxidoreductase subunit F
MESYLLKNINHPDLKLLKTALDFGAYKGFLKCLDSYRPKDVVDEIKASGLRGRGGGWYSTGEKWDSLKKVKDKPAYFCCNCSEGEPGSFKDRLIIEKNPHLLLEGVAIASYALGVNTAYICVRGEFAEATEILKKSLADAKTENLLGKNIYNKGYDLQIIIFRTGGNYICGEETALLNSLEGWPATPREKPPYPAEAGLYGCPTIVNNVETLSNIPYIINNGVDRFRAIGCMECPGNMLFSISGHVNKPGVYEIPIGSFTLREIINRFAGGPCNGHSIKAVIPGGGSSGFLTEKELDITMSPDSLKNIKSSLGTGSIIVMGDQADIVKMTRKLARFFREESCKNECDVCKKGTVQLTFHLLQIEKGEGNSENLNKIHETIEAMKEGGICAMPQISSSVINSALKRFPHEFNNRIDNC